MSSTAIDVPRAENPSSILRWYVLILTCFIYAINIADRYVVSTVLEPIRLELRLDDAGVAFLTGAPLALFYVTFGIPISWLADRANRRNILAISLVVWSAFTALCGLSRNYWEFLLGRIGVGVGEAGGTPPSTAIVSDYFPADRRPMAMTVLALGAPIGAWLGANMAGAVAHAYQLARRVRCPGRARPVVGVIVYLTVREPARGRLDAIVDEIKPSLMRVAALSCGCKRRPSTWSWAAACARCGDGASSTGRPRSCSARTTWTSARPARSPGTFTYRRLARHRRHRLGAVAAAPWRIRGACVWLLAAGDRFATIPSIFAYWTHSLWVCKVMFCIFIPAIYFYIGPCFGLLNNLAPCHMRNMFIAISLLVANVLNLIVAPWVVGVSERLVRRRARHRRGIAARRRCWSSRRPDSGRLIICTWRRAPSSRTRSAPSATRNPGRP